MTSKILSTFQYHSDILFLSKENIRTTNEQEQEVVQSIEVLTGFEHEKGFPKQVNVEGIKDSITAQCLDKSIRRTGSPILV